MSSPMGADQGYEHVVSFDELSKFVDSFPNEPPLPPTLVFVSPGREAWELRDELDTMIERRARTRAKQAAHSQAGRKYEIASEGGGEGEGGDG